MTLEEGLEALGSAIARINNRPGSSAWKPWAMEMLVTNPQDRLPTVTAVMIPRGIDDVKARAQLLDEFNIEIAGGFGPLKGKMWRVGLMGFCSQKANVLLFLAALEKVVQDQGGRVSAGAGVSAAIRSYSHAEAAVAVR